MTARRETSLLTAADTLGWQRLGMDGRGHHRLEHPDTGNRYSVAASPSDYRGLRNAVADLERLSGRRLPRSKAGRSRKTFAAGYLPPTHVERAGEAERTTRGERLTARAEHLAGEIRAAGSSVPSRANVERVRGLLAELAGVNAQLAELHLPHVPASL